MRRSASRRASASRRVACCSSPPSPSSSLASCARVDRFGSRVSDLGVQFRPLPAPPGLNSSPPPPPPSPLPAPPPSLSLSLSLSLALCLCLGTSWSRASRITRDCTGHVSHRDGHQSETRSAEMWSTLSYVSAGSVSICTHSIPGIFPRRNS